MTSSFIQSDIDCFPYSEVYVTFASSQQSNLHKKKTITSHILGRCEESLPNIQAIEMYLLMWNIRGMNVRLHSLAFTEKYVQGHTLTSDKHRPRWQKTGPKPRR